MQKIRKGKKINQRGKKNRFQGDKETEKQRQREKQTKTYQKTQTTAEGVAEKEDEDGERQEGRRLEMRII